MKNQIIEMIENLNAFLDNMKSIAQHPYSLGLNSEKLIVDVKAYLDDMQKLVEKLPEEKQEEPKTVTNKKETK